MMMTPQSLSKMTHEEKDTLILHMYQEIKDLKAFIIALQDKYKVKTTSKNSSLPPSHDHKANVPEQDEEEGNTSEEPEGDEDENPENDPSMPKKKKQRKKRQGPGIARPLHANPHETIDVKLENCTCGEPIPDDLQKMNHEFDHIDIPPIEAKVTRYKLYRAQCPCCKTHNFSKAPEGVDPYKPFGPNIVQTLFYYHYMHFISYERLTHVCQHSYNLQISEGTIGNLLRREAGKFENKVEEIKETIRTAEVINSDETSARVKGINHWEWVFHCPEAVLHIIHRNRSAQVVRNIFGEHKPKYWGADLYSAQRGHGEKFQPCLAHQNRDCQKAIDQGDKAFGEKLKALFCNSITVGKDRQNWNEHTIQAKQKEFDASLMKILEGPKPLKEKGINLLCRYLRERKHIFTFFEHPELEPTNNGSEQLLRLGVIMRKVTNGFRSDWGAKLYADVRSVVGTGKKKNVNPYESIKAIILSG
jgi:transposase